MMEIGLGLSLRRAVDGGFDFHVDSEAGDDGNNGLSFDTAFQTIGALGPVLAEGARIGLKRGSTWLETLDTSAYTGVVIDDYGSPADPMPVIDTSNAALNASFSATVGTTNVFEISWAHDIAAGGFLRVWEDGEALTFASSVANCDATPGSCWYSGNAADNDPLTVYVHPTGSTDPPSDGKAYRLTKRDLCLKIGSNTTVRDLFLSKAATGDGVLLGTGSAHGCTIERCILHWCGKHGAVLNVTAGFTTTFRGVIAYRQIPTFSQWGGGANVITTFFSNPNGGDILYDACVIHDADKLCGGFFDHVSSGAFASTTFRDCYVFGGGGIMYWGNATSVSRIEDCYAENTNGVIATNMDMGVDGCTLIDPAPPNTWRFCEPTAAGITLDVNDLALWSDVFASGGTFWAGATTEYTTNLDHCSIIAHPAPQVSSDDADSRASVTNCVFEGGTAFDLESADGITAADDNVYFDSDGTVEFKVGGETYNGIAAWQAASSLDANSVHADPLWSAEVAAGDFSLQGNSPAFSGGRNAGARKWRTQPNWVALTAQWDAGFYAHPTDAVGGSQLVQR